MFFFLVVQDGQPFLPALLMERLWQVWDLQPD
jgi:hypothetical protein